MIRAAVDTSPLVQTRAGTARHVRGLLGALAGREGIEVTPRSFGGTGKAASLARDTWWYYAGLPLSARGADVLHCTTFRGPLRAAVPFTVTLHDLALVRHPELFPRWHRLSGRAGIGPVARAADRVFAVSEFTKREAVELLGVAEEKVTVIGNAVDPVFSPSDTVLLGDYVLAVATLEPRKNLRRVAEAAARAGVELRVVGAVRLGRRGDARLGRRGVGRGARCALPRRARARLPVALRGVRDPRARGDGLRRARGDEPRRRDRGGGRRRGRAGRPARRRHDRRRDRRGRRPP